MQKFILHVVEPIISMLDYFGLKDPLWRWVGRTWVLVSGASMMALAVAWNFYLYLWELIPLWAVPLFVLANVGIFAITVLGVLWLSVKLADAWAETRKKATTQKNIKEWAERIERECTEMAEYYLSLADANDVYKPTEPGAANWERERAIEKKIRDKFYARYTGKILANNTLIEQLGIAMPWHFRSSIRDQPKSVIAFHSHIAALLKDGYIDQAKAIDDREGFRLIEDLTR